MGKGDLDGGFVFFFCTSVYFVFHAFSWGCSVTPISDVIDATTDLSWLLLLGARLSVNLYTIKIYSLIMYGLLASFPRREDEQP